VSGFIDDVIEMLKDDPTVVSVRRRVIE